VQESIPIVQDSFNYENEIMQDKLVESNPSSNDNLFEQLLSQPESPPNQLLGMIDSNGIEVIEYPMGSGIKWQRNNAEQPWQRL
jgi:hypothetical protein